MGIRFHGDSHELNTGYGSNTLRLLFEACPNAPWNWFTLSYNPNLTIDIILANTDKNWNWSALSIIIPWSDIKKHSELPWRKSGIAVNPTAIASMLLADEHFNNWSQLSMNKTVTIDDVLAHLDKPWDWFELSMRSTITPATVRAYPKLPWSWHGLSYNETWQLNDYDLAQDVNWYVLSYRAVANIVLANCDKPWRWEIVSKYVNITPEILKCEFIKWSYLSANKNITIDVVLTYPNKDWDWDKLSRKLPITLDIIRDNIGLPWNWQKLSYNKSLSPDVVSAYADKPWDHDALQKSLYESKDPLLSWQTIRDNLDKWDWNILSTNKFSYDTKCRQYRLGRHYIQKWRHIIQLRKRRHWTNYVHVMDHLKLYIRDKIAGTLRK